MGILKTLIRFRKDFGFIVIVGIKRKYMTALQNSTRSASKAPSARLGSSLQNQFFNLTKAQGKLGLFLISNHGVFSLKINFKICCSLLTSNLPSNKANDIRYSCSNITTTLIQVSRLFYFGFFSKTNHQMMI